MFEINSLSELHCLYFYIFLQFSVAFTVCLLYIISKPSIPFSSRIQNSRQAISGIMEAPATRYNKLLDMYFREVHKC